VEEIIENARNTVANGIGGVKIKVGQPDTRLDLKRVASVKEALGDATALMVDANQQWNRSTAIRVGRALEEFDLTWIEEPLDAYDAEGHADLARELATPIATGEMLTSVAEHADLIEHRSVDFIQPDAPRVGGITQFLKIMALGERARVRMAPHFAMEIHLHLAAAYEHDPWVEHFDWLEPLFNERLDTVDGRMVVPARPGLGFSFSERAREWTSATERFGSGA
jgi:L-alanine-DL-glutamate epimerase-like enolase superfamily enzyme